MRVIRPEQCSCFQNVQSALDACGQLILRKIINIAATRRHTLRIKCTKSDCGWGSAPDPAGGAHSATPDPLADTLKHALKHTSALNTAARLVFSVRKSEHITSLLRQLHWLRVPERIQFRLCALTYRCLNGTAPQYLAETLQKSADVQVRRRLRSAATSTLIVPSTRRSTLGIICTED